MSILPPIAGLLFDEHNRRHISGDVLTIGRQSVLLSYTECLAMLAARLIGARAGVLEFDKETVGAVEGPGKKYITDRSFFATFTDATVQALDVSGYEGAVLIHDLNAELPSNLWGVADFIFDGSCLDNLFDPARAIKSMSAMLRPGGRLFCFAHATPIQSAYICLSPDWFWDFFRVNNYMYQSVFICSFATILGDWNIVPWVPEAAIPSMDYIVVAIGEKSLDSSDDKTPIQAQYRALHGTI